MIAIGDCFFDCWTRFCTALWAFDAYAEAFVVRVEIEEKLFGINPVTAFIPKSFSSISTLTTKASAYASNAQSAVQNLVQQSKKQSPIAIISTNKFSRSCTHQIASRTQR